MCKYHFSCSSVSLSADDNANQKFQMKSDVVQMRSVWLYTNNNSFLAEQAGNTVMRRKLFRADLYPVAEKNNLTI